MRAALSYCLLLCLAPLACSAAASEVQGPVRGTSVLVTGALLDDESPLLPDESANAFTIAPHELAPRGPRTRETSMHETAVSGAYALDGISRLLARGDEGPACSSKDLQEYFGTTIRLNGVAVVNAAFREHLERFEAVVRDAAVETYGRAPLFIRHRGAFACRSRRGQSSWLSEHALGNAIDVSGFEFGASNGKNAAASVGTPRGAFQVSVARDWQGGGNTPASELHARFLHSLVARLLAQGNVFRGIITPVDAAHSDHFHFDMGPHSYLRL